MPLVLRLPDTAIIPEGATFYDGPDDGKCRLVRANGERCAAIRAKAYGLCNGHAGATPLARNPKLVSAMGHAEKSRRKEMRQTLGISARRVGSARQHARMQALERAEELAAALLAPLDDDDLSALQRQLGALRILDAVEPHQQVSLQVEIPGEAADVGAMTWQGMQELASRLLDISPTQPPSSHAPLALEGA